jgi:hypothetical protein
MDQVVKEIAWSLDRIEPAAQIRVVTHIRLIYETPTQIRGTRPWLTKDEEKTRNEILMILSKVNTDDARQLLQFFTELVAPAADYRHSA